MGIEIRTRAGWTSIGRRPSVLEDERFELRGHLPDSVVTLGRVQVVLEHPISRVRLIEHDELKCHIGLLAVAVDGEPIGEIDVRPGKLTEENWNTLRRELDAVWTGLVLDDPAPTSLEATGPDPAMLWRALGPVVADLAENPVRHLGTHVRWIRRERARSASELNVSVALAGMRGRPGRARSTAPVVAESERALVRDCLQRLTAYSRRHPAGSSVSTAVARFLTNEPFSQPSRSTVHVTHLARHEPRLRQVAAIRQILLNASSLITEGPGELRLGVKGLDKLYEYWVFLKVLEQLRNDFGEPLGRGFQQLATRLPGGRLRLELPAGTTLNFPGGVSVAFAPRITQNGQSSWRGLELAALPSSTGLRTPSSVEPDIALYGGPEHPSLVVIDAKYRARHLVDEALWDVHRKYGRIRQGGLGVVNEVIVAHPHESLTLRWAGQRAVPFVPGGHVCPDLWPGWSRPATPPTPMATAIFNGQTAAQGDVGIESQPEMVSHDPEALTANAQPPDPIETAHLEEVDRANATPIAPTATPTRPPGPAPTAASRSGAVGTPYNGEHPEVLIQDVEMVICDQQWTSTVLFGRRLDFLTLRQMTSVGRPSYMVGSDHGSLSRLHDAAYHRGWNIIVAPNRQSFLAKVDDLLSRMRPSVVALVSGFRDVIELAQSHGCTVDVVDDLEEMMAR